MLKIGSKAKVISTVFLQASPDFDADSLVKIVCYDKKLNMYGVEFEKPCSKLHQLGQKSFEPFVLLEDAAGWYFLENGLKEVAEDTTPVEEPVEIGTSWMLNVVPEPGEDKVDDATMDIKGTSTQYAITGAALIFMFFAFYELFWGR